ncbi:unnamed protein product [Alternaria alternata]
MDAAIDLSDASKALDLANIRFQLIRLEDTITFHLIARVQFPLNKTIYLPGGVDIGEPDTSLFDWTLREQERLQSLVRRYQSPDEYPFFPEVLQEPILKPLNYPQILHPNNVNVNAQLKHCYIKHILPAACAPPTARTGASRKKLRILGHMRSAKFQQETERFVKLIKDEDRKGIDEAITNAAVEKKVNADAVVGMYKNWVIPLTKEVEV